MGKYKSEKAIQTGLYQPKRTHGTENLYMPNEIKCNYVPPMVDTKITPIEANYGQKMMDKQHLKANPLHHVVRRNKGMK